MKRILFISHDASRTGAPMVLLHLLRWLKANGSFDLRLVLMKGGDMEADFAAVVPVWNWWARAEGESLQRRALRKLTGAAAPESPQQQIEAEVRAFRPDIIYGNTVVAQPLTVRFQAISPARIISHVHELQFSLDAYFREEMKPELLAKIDRFIAVSEANRKVLVEHCRIPAEKVQVVHEFIDVTRFSKPSAAAGTAKQSWDLGGYFIVGAAGTPCWRKGFDLFIATAAEVTRQAPGAKIAFVWVGKATDYDKSMLAYQQARLGITVPVLLTGQSTAPENLFQDFDLFYLSSREDPFPLVCLEAAALGKPVLCFEASGGMPEFVQDDAGWVLPYENISETAAALIRLAEHRQEAGRKGEQAREKVSRYDVQVLAPEVAKLLQ